MSNHNSDSESANNDSILDKAQQNANNNSEVEPFRIVLTVKPGTEEHKIFFDFVRKLTAQKRIMKPTDVLRHFMKQYPKMQKLREENNKLRKRVEALEKENKELKR